MKITKKQYIKNMNRVLKNGCERHDNDGDESDCKCDDCLKLHELILDLYDKHIAKTKNHNRECECKACLLEREDLADEEKEEIVELASHLLRAVLRRILK